MSLAQRIFGAGDGTPEPSQVGLKVDVDEALRLLKNQRRRWAIEEVAHSDDRRVELGELATDIALREFECEEYELTSKQRKRVYVGLYQTHLPQLSDEGLIYFDDERGLVYPTANTRPALEFIQITESMVVDGDD